MNPQDFVKWLPWILSALLLVVLVESCQYHTKREENFLNNLKISRDSTHHFVDKHGQLVNENQSMQITVKDLKSQAEALGIDKSKLEDKVGKLSNLVSDYQAKIKVSGTANSVAHDTVIVEVNSKGDTAKVKEKKFDWTNKFLTLSELYNPLNDSIKRKYSYQSNFELTTYFRKKFPLSPFSKRILYADATLTDPNAKLVEGRSIVIQQPPKPLIEKPWFDVIVGVLIGIFIAK